MTRSPDVVVPDALRDAFVPFVRDALGLSFPDNRRGGLERGIASATAALGEARAHVLLERVARGDGAALEALAVGLTVGETYFFRDDPHFTFLVEVALPEALRRGGPVRLWSAGCATGEEAYSLAIAACEALAPADASRLEVLGTDLNPVFLERARAGWYGAWSFRGVDPARRARWFSPAGDGWQVHPGIQRMVHFTQLNLAGPRTAAWPRGVDVVFCRNVMIYFDADAIARAAAGLADALVDGGWLVPGPSDPVLPPDAGLTMSAKGILAYRRGPGSAPPPAPAPMAPAPRAATSPPARRRASPAPPAPLPRRASPAPPAPRRAALAVDARALADAGDLAGARAAVDAALRADGRDPALYLLRSTVRQAAGDDRGACDDADRAILLDRSLAFAQLLSATAHARLGDHAAARRGLRNARVLLGEGDDDTPVPLGQGLTRRAALALCARLERSLGARKAGG